MQKGIIIKNILGCKYTIITVFSIFLALNVNSQPIVSKRISKVVIDAGHGGKDPGAIGSFSKEKDIALSVALKTGELIKEQYPDVQVIYTRDNDRFIELYQRSKIANKEKADLFISIHCNSNVRKDANGAEFWVLGLHKADENLDVAKKENAVVSYEGNVTENYGFDPNSPEGNILMTMRQSLYLDKSIQFAKSLEKRVESDQIQTNRGTKQAGFVVLYQSSMPSVLIELGFISNPKEEEYLNSEKGQIELSSKISDAFGEFKDKFESSAAKIAVKKEAIIEKTIDKENNQTFKNSKDAASTPVTPAMTRIEKIKSKIIIEDDDLQPVRVEKYVVKSTEDSVVKTKVEPTEKVDAILNTNDKVVEEKVVKVEKAVEPVKSNPNKVSASVLTENPKKKVIYLEDDINSEVAAKVEKKPIVQKVVKETPTFVKDQEVKTEIINNTKVIDKAYKTEVKPLPKVTSKVSTSSGLVYKVQIKASSSRIENPAAQFSTIDNIEESFEDTYYKYLSGEFSTLNDAKSHQEQLKAKGYTDCFIVKYQNGVRIK